VAPLKEELMDKGERNEQPRNERVRLGTQKKTKKKKKKKAEKKKKEKKGQLDDSHESTVNVKKRRGTTAGHRGKKTRWAVLPSFCLKKRVATDGHGAEKRRRKKSGGLRKYSSSAEENETNARNTGPNRRLEKRKIKEKKNIKRDGGNVEDGKTLAAGKRGQITITSIFRRGQNRKPIRGEKEDAYDAIKR